MQTGPAPVQTGPALAQTGPILAQTGPILAQTGPSPGSTSHAAGAGADTGPGRPVARALPRLAACCQIMMGVAMAYMLILML